MPYVKVCVPAQAWHSNQLLHISASMKLTTEGASSQTAALADSTSGNSKSFLGHNQEHME
jgi:hypothetical protein